MGTWGSDASYALAPVPGRAPGNKTTYKFDQRWKYWEPYMIIMTCRDGTEAAGLKLAKQRCYARNKRLREAGIPWTTINAQDLDDPRHNPYQWEKLFTESLHRRTCRVAKGQGSKRKAKS